MENKNAVYRQIRYDRTYRPLGKMTWWRIVLGAALLLFAVLLSGVPSQHAAARGHYRTAKTLMVSPSWMETYKPEVKAWIEGGVFYLDGDYEKARETLENAGDSDAVRALRSRNALKQAAEMLDAGERDAAADVLLTVTPALLSDKEQQTYLALREALAAPALAG